MAFATTNSFIATADFEIAENQKKWFPAALAAMHFCYMKKPGRKKGPVKRTSNISLGYGIAPDEIFLVDPLNGLTSITEEKLRIHKTTTTYKNKNK
ncbi:MAG: hypothetical protein U0V74_05120 [Chitinophagales bacterium]